MGEISDSIINGDFDFITGEYLGEGGGFPRTSERGYRKKKVKHTPRNGMNGVFIFLNNRGYKETERVSEIIKDYVKFMGWSFGKNRHVIRACIEIQKDFTSFTNWLKQTGIIRK